MDGAMVLRATRLLLLIGIAMVTTAAPASGAGPGVLPPGTYPFRTYGSESGLGSLAAMQLAQDKDGYIWVAAQDGAYRYDGTR